jgi:uncharacterized protein
MPNNFSPLRLFILFLIVILTNSVLWLDSLDNYFNNQKHVLISNVVPDWFFTPSQRLHLKTQSADLFGMVGIVSNKNKTVDQAVEYVLKIEKTPLSSTPKVLFAGDSLMQGVAPIAIADLKKIYPNGKFIDLSQQSTGLTVRRYFDWPKKIQEESLRQGFNVVIIFLGANDPWDIYENKKHFVFPSNEWQELYRERVNEVLLFAKEHQIHVIWVGLPNMEVERVRAGAIVQNTVFQSETKKNGFDFISTEEILGSLDAPFTKYSQDPVKGSILIRANDGIHFTPNGYRLVSNQIIKTLKEKF